MPRSRSIRRILLGVGILVLLVAFVPPSVSLNRFRGRIANSLGNALGRQVTVRSVNFRLFPQPGFDLTNFVVQDDPAFSAEPMLRADEVTATLRLSSLWRGRLEIGTLSLQYPSLNLVRNQEGRWNVESLLARAAQTPTAPTAKTRPEARPRFPYVEAAGGRINFKLGQEKKVYALNDSDFALWLASEDEWNMRLAARPVRTDANLSDTGRIQVSGTFGRSPRLRNTPLKVRLALQRAQLGQLTTLVYGRDRGWRGALNITLALAGTPADLTWSGEASVDDFRRHDIVSGEAVRLSARCVGKYRLASEELSGIDCHIAQQSGDIAVRGMVSGIFGARNYNLSLSAKDVPMSELVRIARHAKLDLPQDLTATGDLDAAFTFRSPGNAGDLAVGWAGGGSTDNFVLQSRALGPDLRIGTIRFAVSRALPNGGSANSRGRLAVTRRDAMNAAPPSIVMVEPFTLALGGSSPATVRASLTRFDYTVDVRGEAEVSRLLNVARGVGIRAPYLSATGGARLGLQIAGKWAEFAAPAVSGTLQLRNVTAQIKGVAAPLHLESAAVALTPAEVNLQKLAASFPGSPMTLEGSVKVPRICDSPEPCPARFELHASQLVADELNRLLNPQLRKKPWYRMTAADAGGSLGKLRAEGRLTADRLVIKAVVANHVTAQVQVAGGRLRLSDVRGELFGGRHRGEWRADFTGEPVYTGSGMVEHASLAQIGSAMHDDWASGTVSGIYRVTISGWTAPQLAQSAAGSLQFDWREGVLQHVALEEGGKPLHWKRCTGRATLRNRSLELAPSKMETADGSYEVSGTASFARQLDLRLLGHKAHGYTVSGSLEKPRVTVLGASETQAALAK